MLHVCENTSVSNYSIVLELNLSKAFTIVNVNGENVIVMTDLGVGLSLISTDLVQKWQLKQIKKEQINRREIQTMIMVKTIEDDTKVSIDNKVATERLKQQLEIDDNNNYAPIMIKDNPNIQLCSYAL